MSRRRHAGKAQGKAAEVVGGESVPLTSSSPVLSTPTIVRLATCVAQTAGNTGASVGGGANHARGMVVWR